MTQYIDKAALIAEIDRQKIGYNVDGKHSVEYDITKKIIDIITTLEVKEVDLEKEIKNFTEELFHKTFDEDKSQDDFWNDVATVIEYTAKHFFELGLSTERRIKL